MPIYENRFSGLVKLYYFITLLRFYTHNEGGRTTFIMCNVESISHYYSSVVINTNPNLQIKEVMVFSSSTFGIGLE